MKAISFFPAILFLAFGFAVVTPCFADENQKDDGQKNQKDDGQANQKEDGQKNQVAGLAPLKNGKPNPVAAAPKKGPVARIILKRSGRAITK